MIKKYIKKIVDKELDRFMGTAIADINRQVEANFKILHARAEMVEKHNRLIEGWLKAFMLKCGVEAQDAKQGEVIE